VYLYNRLEDKGELPRATGTKSVPLHDFSSVHAEVSPEYKLANEGAAGGRHLPPISPEVWLEQGQGLLVQVEIDIRHTWVVREQHRGGRQLARALVSQKQT
jgi:hypothetical protein